MIIKYQKLMEEYKVTLDNPVLDPAFVSKANTFEEKLKGNQLTDDEIKAADDELVELFNQQELSEEDSDELKQAKYEKDLAVARAAIAEESDLQKLLKMQSAYKDFPQVLPVLKVKIEKLQQAEEAAAGELRKKNEKNQKDAAREAAIEAGTKEIASAGYEDLPALGEKYKQFPELVKSINERQAKEKPVKDEEALKTKLLSRNEWNYPMLNALGIKPTGNDMVVAGVHLDKEFIVDVYKVVRK